MTREEFEAKAIDMLKELVEVYHNEYNADGKYLTLTYLYDHYSINNSYYDGGEDEDKPINAYINLDEENV